MTTEQKHTELRTLARSLSSALVQVHSYTEGHSEAVNFLSVYLAKQLKPEWTPDMLEELSIGALLHDIGKLAAPWQILNGTGTTLTTEQRVTIVDHPYRGLRIVMGSGVFIPEMVKDCIEYHHERWDGKTDGLLGGYPRGLKGKKIPLCARIIAVADTWNAITTDRTYQRARSKAEATSILKSLAGNRLDPLLVKVFIEFVVPALAA